MDEYEKNGNVGRSDEETDEVKLVIRLKERKLENLENVYKFF